MQLSPVQGQFKIHGVVYLNFCGFCIVLINIKWISIPFITRWAGHVVHILGIWQVRFSQYHPQTWKMKSFRLRHPWFAHVAGVTLNTSMHQSCITEEVIQTSSNLHDIYCLFSPHHTLQHDMQGTGEQTSWYVPSYRDVRGARAHSSLLAALIFHRCSPETMTLNMWICEYWAIVFSQ